MNKLERVANYYGKGYTIVAIAEEMRLTEEIVVDYLKDYKNSQKHNRQYSEDMMMLVAKRDSHDFKRKDIMSELGISRNFLAKSIEKYGFIDKNRHGDGEEFYSKVHPGFEFSHCPKCESKDINEVETLYDNTPVRGIYCLSCGNEFAKRNDELYIVKWENIG